MTRKNIDINISDSGNKYSHFIHKKRRIGKYKYLPVSLPLYTNKYINFYSFLRETYLVTMIIYSIILIKNQ